MSPIGDQETPRQTVRVARNRLAVDDARAHRQCTWLVAVILLIGVATAAAAGMPSDALKLTSAQQKTAWHDLTMPSFSLNTDQRMAANSGPTPLISSNIAAGRRRVAGCTTSINSTGQLAPKPTLN